MIFLLKKERKEDIRLMKTIILIVNYFMHSHKAYNEFFKNIMYVQPLYGVYCLSLNIYMRGQVYIKFKKTLLYTMHGLKKIEKLHNFLGEIYLVLLHFEQKTFKEYMKCQHFLLLALNVTNSTCLYASLSLKGQCHEIFCFWFFS